MTAEFIFQIVNVFAVTGWIILILSVIFKKSFFLNIVAGQVWPISLAIVYTCLIIFFWTKSPGGFDTLGHVRLLFTSPWAALAGWIHYLAFDLFVGTYIAKQVMERDLPRLSLVALLPLTFLFGPIGYLGLHLVRLGFHRVEVSP